MDDEDRSRRAAGWRVPPHSWVRDFGIWTALFILLLWPSILLTGWLGIVVLATVLLTLRNIASTVSARKRSRS